ncbi:MAG: hypothetical protein A2X46_17120 [Lentisphaerae bacterium GWF2_57_35]|nr:MAG: hypothetical protein A2X46_17120 [Lentisphaerae bacterium GWF2_57_35]
MAAVILVASGEAVLADNLLRNASFETLGQVVSSADQWDDNDGGGTWGGILCVNWNAYDANFSMVMPGGWNGAVYGGFWQRVNVVQGQTYIVGARFFKDNNWSAASSLLKVEWYDAEHHMISMDSQSLASIPYGQWTSTHWSFTAPAGASVAHYVVDLSGVAYPGAFYVDTAYFGPINPFGTGTVAVVPSALAHITVEQGETTQRQFTVRNAGDNLLNFRIDLAVTNPTAGASSLIEKTVISTNHMNPRFMATADVDGDGDADAYVAYYNGDVLLMENRGGGTGWVQHTISTQMEYPQFLASSDMDQDGDMDLVCGALTDGLVWWENSNGTASGHILHTIGPCNYLDAMAVGDMDGNGSPDVLAVGIDKQLVEWRNVDGQGTSWASRTLFHGTSSNEFKTLDMGDVDGDGDVDVAAADYWNYRVLWLENQTGNTNDWPRQVVDASFRSGTDIRVIDMDHDGDIDVFANSSSGGGNLTWWENTQGAGSEWVKHAISEDATPTYNARLADVDQDGDWDVAASYGWEFDWWENRDGAGQTWTRRKIASYSSIVDDVGFGDFNHDGRLDVSALTGAGYGEAAWWKNEETVRWVSFLPASAQLLPGESMSVDVLFDAAYLPCSFYDEASLRISANDPATSITPVPVSIDVTCEFNPHIVANPATLPAVTVEEGQCVERTVTIQNTGTAPLEFSVAPGRTGFLAIRPLPEFEGEWLASCALDIDQDGHTDFPVIHPGASGLDWWTLLEGNWTIRSAAIDTYGSARPNHVEDVDHDGDMDLVGSSDSRFAWWENTDGAGLAWTFQSYTGELYRATAGDVDGDGDVDFVGARSLGGAYGIVLYAIYWIENAAGDGSTWVEHDTGAQINSIRNLRLFDQDLDGDLDIAGHLSWALHGTGESRIFFLENREAANEGWGLRSYNSSDGIEPLPTDVDRDGDLDVVTACGQLVWWENLGADWAVHTNAGVEAPWGNLVVGDMNGDGDDDLLCPGVWWERQAGATIGWRAHSVTPLVPWEAADPVLADVDGDGHTDLVASGLWVKNAPQDGPGWLRAWPEYGTVLPGSSLDITACFSAWELPAGFAGSHRIAILSNDSSSPTNLIQVSIVVTASAASAQDSDNDGMPDEWELQYGLDTTNATDAATDSDGDGLSNQDEFRAGTLPSDPNSSLRILQVDLQALNALFVCQGGTNVSQYLMFTEDLASGAWRCVGTNSSPATATSTLQIPAGPESGFYRLRVIPAQ